MFRSFISIGPLTSRHLGAPSDMRGSNHFFIFCNVVVRIKGWQSSSISSGQSRTILKASLSHLTFFP
ncbi:hypothetical protein H5410_030810 [Solanum commersonii]|uniref:Uncharacterized protein n=1 Tax=Solanum commersonii TaxID=4109 RepID=A0A9J5YIH0_SOLCO|nr:hypothetical protein H5410_030810 [Solanum commersonii]